MSLFLDQFPKIVYSLNNDRNQELITNIFFRLAFLKSLQGNISSYYNYFIKDGETPEILADRFYNNPEAHWIILFFNNIRDPIYDWPMDNRTFNRYIIAKYGSTQTAMTTYHDYSKTTTYVMRNIGGFQDVTTSFTSSIDSTNVAISTANTTNAAYDTYSSLPETQFFSVDVANNRNIEVTITRDRITNYDWEMEQNDARRTIKIIDPQFIPQIMQEFNSLVSVNDKKTGKKSAR